MDNAVAAGIAVLVIAVILVVALALTYHTGQPKSLVFTTAIYNNNVNYTGIQNNPGSTNLTRGCTNSGKFGCANASINSYGQLSLTLDSNSNITLNNVHVACIAYNGLSLFPTSSSAWYSLTDLGTTKAANFTGTAIQPGSIKNIANLQCYSPSGAPISLSSGQDYLGLLLVNYTPTSAPQGPGNRWITIGAVAVNVKAP